MLKGTSRHVAFRTRVFTLILTHATNLFIIWKEQDTTTENANRSDIPLHVHDLNKQNNILHRHKQLRTFQQLTFKIRDFGF